MRSGSRARATVAILFDHSFSTSGDYLSKPCLRENITKLSDDDVEIAFSKSLIAPTGTGHFVGEAFLFEQTEQGWDNLVITLEAEQFYVVVEFAIDAVAQFTKDEVLAVCEL
ncbi:MAG: hypothetical protein K8R87_09145 [Verrucomicrobia bacterium]|nr:hypothetical protein [Verrucomicrobiota bacterium]